MPTNNKMAVESPVGLPLSLSDLRSPEKNVNKMGLKLEPIPEGAIKKRRRNKSKKSKPLKESTSVSKPLASDEDIESYINERLSRLDSVPELNPIPGLDQDPTPLKKEPQSPTSSKTSTQNNPSPVQSQPTPSLSGIGLLEPNSNHQLGTGGLTTPPQLVSSEDPLPTEERRRRRRRKTKKTHQLEETSLQENTTDNLVSLTTTSKRELPELSLDQPPTVVEEGSTGLGDSSTPNYDLSCPTDPIFLVDEEDIQEVPVSAQVPGIIKGPMKTTGGLAQSRGGDQGILDKGPVTNGNQLTYRQQPETGGFTRVTRKRGATLDDIEEDVDSGGLTGPFNLVTNTKFILFIHNFVKRVSFGAHGVLTGLCLWNSAVSITLLSQPSSDINLAGHVVFLKYYSDFPVILHSLYLLLLFIVMVTILDRINVSRLGVECIKRCSHNLSEIALSIALILLLTAFTLTTTMGFIDERIQRFEDHPNLWTDLLYSTNTTLTTTTPLFSINNKNYYARSPGNTVTSDRLTAWAVLDAIRTISILGSWLIVLCSTSSDRMEEYISDLEYQNNIDSSNTV